MLSLTARILGMCLAVSICQSIWEFFAVAGGCIMYAAGVVLAEEGNDGSKD